MENINLTLNGRHEIIHFIENGIEYPFAAFEQIIVGQQLVVDAHYHEYIEILYCQEGCFNMFLDGISYTIGKGDMAIINSNEVHYIHSLSEGTNDYIVIRFSPELLYTTSQTIFETKYVLPFTMRTSTHEKVFCKDEICGTSVPWLLQNVLKEDDGKNYGYELAIRTYLGEVFLWILRNWHKKGLDLNLGSGLNQDVMERLVKVFKYVDEHYTEPIGIEELANHCGMSYSYFSRFFKKSMNRNFSDYVNLVRISKAEHLIAATDLSITDIALEVGFSTSSYFIEQFKRIKGMTPKKFRSRFLQGLSRIDISPDL